MKTFFTRKSTFKNYLISLLAFFAISFIWGGLGVFAAPTGTSQQGITVDAILQPDAKYAGDLLNQNGTGLQATVGNVIFAELTEAPIRGVLGVGFPQLTNCTGYVAENTNLLSVMEGDRLKNWQKIADASVPDEVICASLMDTYGTYGNTSNTTQTSYIYEPTSSPIGGSLLAFEKAVKKSTYEPIPVNMAYFFYDAGSRLPIVGDRVYAATPSYSSPLLDNVMELWKLARDISYGLMAIILLVVGIMIITRKQVSSQVVVSVQYALPKIVIALVLITFSYPIGASIASMGWAMFHSAPNIIKEAFVSGGAYSDLSDLWLSAGLISIILGFMITLIIEGGIGWTILLGVVVVVAVVVMMAILAWMKALVVYFKMVVMVILSPFEFVLYAIPGNDDRLGNWFKRMAALALSMFAVNAMLTLCNLITLNLIFSAESTFGNLLFAIFAPVVVYIYGLSLVISMPKKIEGWIVGEQKRR